MRILRDEELASVRGGEPLTLSAVMAMMAVAVVTIVCYKLFQSGKGKVSLPGPFSFSWE